MLAIFNLEIVFEHPAWRILTDLEIPYTKYTLEQEETVHIVVENEYCEKVADALRNLRITI
jgi:ribulose 1,5-bisphosphate synthetase/thiazole synthase